MSSISLKETFNKTVIVNPGFERPSRVVVALRRRKSLARVTSCFVGHRSKKQLLISFYGASDGIRSRSRVENSSGGRGFK